MRPRKLGRRLVVVLGIVMVLSLIAPQAAQATTYNEKLSTYLINHYDRNPRGLRSLVLNEFVSNIARSHSVQMARAGKIYHSNLSSVDSRIAGWRVLGENVGMGPDIRVLNQAFMNSPGHRANLLCKCFSRIGVGVVQSGRTYFVTHIFYG